MEKKSLSAVDISKKLIWEYIIVSFIFGIINHFIIGSFIRNMENATAEMILQIILTTITTFLYVWVGSRNVVQRYFIRKEDINIIIRNIGIFFVVMIVIGFIIDYNSYQKFMQEQAQIYRISGVYDLGDLDDIVDEAIDKYQNYRISGVYDLGDLDDIVDEAIDKYQNNESYADIYTNLKEKQEENFKKEFSQKYGYIIFVPLIYDIVLYGMMIYLQRKWLIKVAE